MSSSFHTENLPIDQLLHNKHGRVMRRTAEHIWEDMRSDTGRMRGGIGSSPGACLEGVSKTIACAVHGLAGKPTGRIDNGRV